MISSLRAKQLIEKHNFENSKFNSTSVANLNLGNNSTEENTVVVKSTNPVSPILDLIFEGDDSCPDQATDNTAQTQKLTHIVTLDLQNVE